MKVLTRSHCLLDLTAISAQQITKLDLHALVNIGRFTAQTVKFWSVAQHSMIVAQVVRDLGGDDNAYAWGLLHDCHEAYLGDHIRPLLEYLGPESMAALDRLRSRIDAAVANRFAIKLDESTAKIVQEADDIVLAAEILAFFSMPSETLIQIPAVKKYWPLIQYFKLDVIDPKKWVQQVEALWPAAAEIETPVGAA